MKGKSQTQEKIPVKELWKAAPSLRPGMSMIEMAARKNPYACAVRDAWQFRHPVSVLSREAYAELVERCTVTFDE